MQRFAGGWYDWLDLTQPGKRTQEEPPGLQVGDFFPACNLVLLKSKEDRPYLGLPADAKSFALREVRATYLVVEFYSELCFGCLKEVGAYNQLFTLMARDRALSGRMKMMGLGVASQYRDVVRFRREQGVLFPLFADPRQQVFECLGRPTLPVLYLLRKEPEGGFRILFKHSGHVGSPQELLALLKAETASKAP